MRPHTSRPSLWNVVLRPSVVGLVVFVALFRLWVLYVTVVGHVEDLRAAFVEPLAMGWTLERWMLAATLGWVALMLLELRRVARTPRGERAAHVAVVVAALALVAYNQYGVHALARSVEAMG